MAYEMVLDDPGVETRINLSESLFSAATIGPLTVIGVALRDEHTILVNTRQCVSRVSDVGDGGVAGITNSQDLPISTLNTSDNSGRKH